MRPLFRTHHGVSYVARDHDDVVLEVLFAKALDPAHVAVLVDVDGIVRYVNVRGPAIERLVKQLIESQATEKKTGAANAPDSPKRRVGRLRRGRRGAENVRR